MNAFALAIIGNFVRSMGGPRSLGLLLIVALLISVVIYQFMGNSGEEEIAANRTTGRKRLANFLILMMAVVFVLGFLVIACMFLYLMFMA